LTQLRSAPSTNPRARATDKTVLDRPELSDVEDLTPLLEVPEKYAGPGSRAERPVFSSTEVTDVLPRTPKHRRQPTSAARGRAWIAAMAAGAAAAAAYTMIKPADQGTTRTVLASDLTPLDSSGLNRGPELVAVKPAANVALHAEEAARGAAFAAERAVREARLQQPLFVLPTRGIFTSGFGYRWGALHDGVDLAGPIGTPVYAASDGVVKEAGYTNSGYGAWVLITHPDGTVTRYGHIDSWTVGVGQRVFAGDQIATIGNRGNSTGPHLHFSVLLGGTNATDPASWLAARGVSVGPYTG
ncbi:MAG: M23 family metallopeptidase, partial [Mycobacterium sp.]